MIGAGCGTLAGYPSLRRRLGDRETISQQSCFLVFIQWVDEIALLLLIVPRKRASPTKSSVGSDADRVLVDVALSAQEPALPFVLRPRGNAASLVPVCGAASARTARQHGACGGCAVNGSPRKVPSVVAVTPSPCMTLQPRASGLVQVDLAQTVSCVIGRPAVWSGAPHEFGRPF
jgi:hypothetical protein